MKEPTPEIARAFAEHMIREFGATLHEKDDPLRLSVALGVRILGLDPAHYATTLADHIFTPFKFGERVEGAWALWEQMEVLVHECQHVEQYRRNGLRAGLDYIGSTAKRAANEAQCLSSNLELHHWRYGQIESWYPRARVEGLLLYGCSARDVLVAEKHTRMIGLSAKRGLVITRAARTALAWLNANAPDLKA